ncbi:MAG: lytic transglycosylase domain-containing protein [Clostridia bacterium]|nr:lytic transglycosylase domain-containing protein [Clostridia bacterium]
MFAVSALFLFWISCAVIKIIYPLKYEDTIENMSQKYNIEKPLIYAIIKCESDFEEKAESSAGALGLMQITPDTFRWLEKYTHNHYISKEDMLNPENNIECGTLFMSVLLEKYKNLDVSLSAYNAGIKTIDGWLKEKENSHDGKSLHNIPYGETKKYVNKVNFVYKVYKFIYFR